ncbi:MAG: acyl-CoA dehydrogenase family protein [Pseudomonadota bacterium]
MLLSEDQIQIRNLARDFAEKEVIPNSLEWDLREHVPLDQLAKMGELGFMGMLTPSEWGGVDVDFVSYVLVTQEFAGADAGLCNMMNAVNSPVCAALVDHATNEQKEWFLRPLASGKTLGAIALTEPHSGSDASALTTTAQRRNNGNWVINGRKQYITSGQSAGICMIIAKTAPEKGKQGISAFFVPTDTPGYQVTRLEKKLGHRTCDTAELLFEDLEVDEGCLVGGEGNGYRISLAYLEGGRIGVAAQAVGVARRAYETAVSYARERQTFNKPIIEHQAVNFMLADMATKVETANQMTLYAARLRDAGEPSLKAASMAKLYATQIAEEVCSDAVQIHGGSGFCHGVVEKLYRDCRVYKIYEGTNEIQKLVIGREIMAGR